MKTSELTGPALDYAVFIAKKFSYWTVEHAPWSSLDYTDWVLSSKGVLERHYFDGSRSRAGHWEVELTWCPSTDWDQGGPILEELKIALIPMAHHWEAQAPDGTDAGVPLFVEQGPTPLVAAMRCFVASKLGDEIELPKELK